MTRNFLTHKFMTFESCGHLATDYFGPELNCNKNAGLEHFLLFLFQFHLASHLFSVSLFGISRIIYFEHKKMESNFKLDTYLICVFIATIVIILYGCYQLWMQWNNYKKRKLIRAKNVDESSEEKVLKIQMTRISNENNS